MKICSLFRKGREQALCHILKGLSVAAVVGRVELLRDLRLGGEVIEALVGEIVEISPSVLILGAAEGIAGISVML